MREVYREIFDCALGPAIRWQPARRQLVCRNDAGRLIVTSASTRSAMPSPGCSASSSTESRMPTPPCAAGRHGSGDCSRCAGVGSRPTLAKALPPRIGPTNDPTPMSAPSHRGCGFRRRGATRVRITCRPAFDARRVGARRRRFDRKREKQRPGSAGVDKTIDTMRFMRAHTRQRPGQGRQTCRVDLRPGPSHPPRADGAARAVTAEQAWTR